MKDGKMEDSDIKMAQQDPYYWYLCCIWMKMCFFPVYFGKNQSWRRKWAGQETVTITADTSKSSELIEKRDERIESLWQYLSVLEKHHVGQSQSDLLRQLDAVQEERKGRDEQIVSLQSLQHQKDEIDTPQPDVCPPHSSYRAPWKALKNRSDGLKNSCRRKIRRSAGPARKRKRVPKLVSTADTDWSGLKESRESLPIWRKSRSRAEDPEEPLGEGAGLQEGARPVRIPLTCVDPAGRELQDRAQAGGSSFKRSNVWSKRRRRKSRSGKKTRDEAGLLQGYNSPQIKTGVQKRVNKSINSTCNREFISHLL